METSYYNIMNFNVLTTYYLKQFTHHDFGFVTGFWLFLLRQIINTFIENWTDILHHVLNMNDLYYKLSAADYRWMVKLGLEKYFYKESVTYILHHFSFLNLLKQIK